MTAFMPNRFPRLFAQWICEGLRLAHELATALYEPNHCDGHLAYREKPAPQIGSMKQCRQRAQRNVFGFVQCEEGTVPKPEPVELLAEGLRLSLLRIEFDVQLASARA
jgi:hypothetical protein